MDETALDGFAVDSSGVTCLACGQACRELREHDTVADLIGAARLHETVCRDGEAP